MAKFSSEGRPLASYTSKTVDSVGGVGPFHVLYEDFIKRVRLELHQKIIQ